MSFLVYDLIFLAVFSLIVFIFLYSNRKNLKREGIMYLYRTKIGLRGIDYFGKKHKKLLSVLSYVVITFGYVAMFVMLYLLWKTVMIFFQFPEFVRAVKIPPLAPLIPYLPQLFNADYLPVFYFTYWIIVIAVVGIVHEFSHGIFARLYNIKIKSTGFAFLGPFIGAFVEPDEKQMKKSKKKEQLAILAAGTFSNAVLTALFFAIFWLFISLTFTASGVIFNSYDYTAISKTSISEIGKNITINFDGGLNLTEIKAGNKTYFISTSVAGEINGVNSSGIIVFEDSPALKAGLSGVITAIDGEETDTEKELRKVMQGYKPGDNITITTLDIKTETKKDYNLTLGEHPGNRSLPYIGIVSIKTEATSLLGKIKLFLIFFEDPNTYYAPKFLPDFVVFIKYLLWWLVFINLSVALANMLPAGIFDGGRFFYLTMLSIFKNEKVAKVLFKVSTYFILAVFVLLMVLWAYSFF